MVRVSGKKSKAKRDRPKRVTARQRRKSIQKSQLRVRKTTLEVKKAVSQRGRTMPMEQAMPGMPQTPQELLMYSTAIKRFKYWTDTRRLRIWFVKGGVYDYFNVPESIVIDLSQAQSKGNYFYYNIRMSFNYSRIR